MRNRITAFALMTEIVASALLIISLAAYAQQSSDKSVISLSTVSKLDRSQPGIYRTKVGKFDVIAVSDGTAATAVEPQKTFFAQVDPKVKPYMDSGQLKTFEGATEFFPGFRSEPAYGHTAGLTVYILEDGGEKVMFWGDVVNIALQVDDPDISLRFDSDVAAAAATRRRLLEDAARKGYVVAPDHLPFPGLGHIRKDGQAYTWVPVDYVNDAVEK